MSTYLVMPVARPGEFHLYIADSDTDAVIAHGEPGKMFVVEGQIVDAVLAATVEADTPPAASDPEPAAAAAPAAAADPALVALAPDPPLPADSGPIAPADAGEPDDRPTESGS